MPRRLRALSLALVAAAACSTPTTSNLDRATVAFVLVGASNDLGYNQAVFEGSLEVARRLPDVTILRVEGVPEDDEAGRTIRRLVERDGADIVFATSFGHLEQVHRVAQDHPEVVFLHQGGVEPEPRLDNFGTYFGSHWEAMYEAGIAAGHASRTQVLGFVAAFDIPATRANVNALTLGARRVHAESRTLVAFTDAWCDPEAQRAAADALVAAGADVLAQHQDCTSTVLQRAEARRLAGTIGYHADGSEVAPTTWLTGAVWTWGELYADIVETILDGRFVESPYNGDHRGSLVGGDNPFTLTSPGPSLSSTAVEQMARVRAELASGSTPFVGPLRDAAGRHRLAAGEALTLAEVDRLDWFVSGVEVLEPAPDGQGG